MIYRNSFGFGLFARFLVLAFVGSHVAGAATLFTEDFEDPVVSGYSQGTTPAGWVRAAQGYRSSYHGLINKDGGAFTCAVGAQGYAFRYTNSGVTTDQGVIGSATANLVYTVTFSHTTDGDTSGTAYDISLIAFADGDPRNDCRSIPPNSTQLNRTTGNSTLNDMSESDTCSFTISAADIYLGDDMGVRFIGSGSRAIVDNVQVDTIAVPSYYWDINDTTAGSGGATPAGTWDGANTYWNPASDGTGTAVAWSSDYNAVFAGGTDANGTYTVAISGTVDIGSLYFEEGTVTLSGGTALRMIRNTAVDVASGVTATIATPISQDTADRTFGKVGDGTLVLSAAATYTTGNTLVRAGTLQLGASNIIPNGSPVYVNGNAAGVTATLDLNGYSDTLDSLILGGMSTSSGAAITTGAGTLTLDGNVTYNSASNPVGATINGNLSLGSSTRTFTVGDSATATDDLALAGVVSGSGGLTKNGTGRLYFGPSTNTYSGVTTVSAGDLVVDVGGSCSNSAVTFSGGDLLVNVTDNTLHWGCGGLSYASVGAMDFSFGAVVPSASVASLQVSGDVAFTATPTVSCTGAGLTGLAPGSYPLVTWTGSFSGTAPSAVALASGSGILVLDTGNKTLWLSITGSEQPLTWLGPAASEWKANEVTYTYWRDASPVTTNYSEYSVGGVAAGDNVVFDDNGPGGTVAINTMLYPASVTVSGTKSYTFTGPGGMSSSGPFVMSSSGTLTLSTSNALSSSVSISAGTLSLTSTNAIGTAALNIENACTITLSTNVNVQDINYADNGYAATISGGTLNFAAGSTVTSADDNSFDQTITSAITGRPDVRIAARGNYYGMIFAPTNGTVELGSVTVPYNDGGNDKCLFRMDGTTTNNSVTEIRVDYEQGEVEKRGSGTWSIGSAGYVGNSSGLGWLNVHEGNLVLTGTVTMKNDHDVELYGGVLHYNNEGAIRIESTPTGSLRMRGGALDNSSGAAITTSTYNPPWEWYSDFTFIGSQGADSDLNFGAGVVTLFANCEVTVSNVASTLTAGGNISGSYALTKVGAGTLKLTGANAYSGNTFVNEGTLALSNDAAIPDTADLYITNGAKVALLGGNEAVSNLYLNGELSYFGTWGSSGSPASFTDDSYFSGTGVLTVADGIVVTNGIVNRPATDVTDTSAVLNGQLTVADGSELDVYAYWGASDGTNNPSAWSSGPVLIGSWTNATVTGLSNAVSSLNSGTTYYFTFLATNGAVGIWASPSESFATYGIPVVNNSTGATALTASSATLRGELTVGAEAQAWICWGTSDSGTGSTGDWSNVISIATATQNVEFSIVASSLDTNATYWYRCYAINAYGTDWSDDAATFNGTPVGGGGTWTPEELDLEAWFDAADTDTIIESGGLVSQWNDKSGKLRHAAMGAGNQPTYQASDSMVNNLPSIGDLAKTGEIGLDTPSFGAKTVYVLAYYKDGVDSTFDDYSTLLSGPGANGQYRVMGWSGQSYFYNTSTFNDSGSYVNGSPTALLNGTGVVLPMPATLLKFKASALRTQAYSLGYNNNSAANRDWAGAYCEWIFTDGSEDSDTEDMIEGYLAHKWGIGLVGGHPYEDNPPGGAGAIGNLAPTNITETTAVLNASLSVAAGTNSALYVHFGTTDGGTNFGWTAGYTLAETVTNSTATNETYTISYPKAGLKGGRAYWYTFRASNDAGNAWASPSWKFTTAAPTGVGSVFMFK